MVPGAPIVPGPAAGYPWPYHFNAEAADHPTPHRDSWPLVDEHHPGNYVNGLGQPQYYPAAAGMDPYHVGGHMYNGSPVQYAYQVMRTNGGYALHDIDALVKQDPPIPPPVPAMWSSSSKLTLAKCLENREGITNVYIRGFLPETTDELLYAYASRFGKIERCKAIVDLETGLCKGLVV
jgi:NADPH-ferrihemoprotein reductase